MASTRRCGIRDRPDLAARYDAKPHRRARGATRLPCARTSASPRCLRAAGRGGQPPHLAERHGPAAGGRCRACSRTVGSFALLGAWRSRSARMELRRRPRRHRDGSAPCSAITRACRTVLQGGADVILVPSRFRTVRPDATDRPALWRRPVVARVGGLADTVIDANDAALAAGPPSASSSHPSPRKRSRRHWRAWHASIATLLPGDPCRRAHGDRRQLAAARAPVCRLVSGGGGAAVTPAIRRPESRVYFTTCQTPPSPFTFGVARLAVSAPSLWVRRLAVRYTHRPCGKSPGLGSHLRSLRPAAARRGPARRAKPQASRRTRSAIGEIQGQPTSPGR